MRRVNYSNVFYIMETYDNFLVNRVVLTHRKHPEMVDACYIGMDNGIKKFTGYIQIHLFSARRYLDDVDYVFFLNGKEIKE